VRQLRQHVTWPGTGLVLAALLAFVLLAAAVVLNGVGAGRGCAVPGTTCAGQLPVRATPVAGALAVR
jgi:hypothetical protein